MRISARPTHYMIVDGRDQSDEALFPELDRLEAILAEREAEIRRLKSETELQGLYMDELHAALQAQGAEFSVFDERLRLLEPDAGQGRPRPALPPLPFRRWRPRT